MLNGKTWEKRIWENLNDLLKVDENGNLTLKVSFEDDSTDNELDPAEMQRVQLQVSLEILKQLTVVNLHLSHLSDQRFLPEDIEEHK
jgi:hypothetical protein